MDKPRFVLVDVKPKNDTISKMFELEKIMRDFGYSQLFIIDDTIASSRSGKAKRQALISQLILTARHNDIHYYMPIVRNHDDDKPFYTIVDKLLRVNGVWIPDEYIFNAEIILNWVKSDNSSKNEGDHTG